MDLERIARAHAQKTFLEKRAGVAKAINAVAANPAALGGAVLGAGIGAYRGRAGSREGEKGYGALTGGLLGAVAGGVAGAGARNLIKTVPAGSKQIKAGKAALEKELAARGIKASDKAAVKEYLAAQRSAMSDATSLASAGKHGAEARAAIDAARKPFGAVADIRAGREKFYGGIIGGGLGLGYGGYQLYDMKNINAPAKEEKMIKEYDALNRQLSSKGK